MKFSNYWAPADGHLYLWGRVRQGGIDLFPAASQEGLCGQPSGKK